MASFLRPHWTLAVNGRATVVQALPEMMEILPAGASKGTGVQRLLDHLGVPIDQVSLGIFAMDRLLVFCWRYLCFRCSSSVFCLSVFKLDTFNRILTLKVSNLLKLMQGAAWDNL